MTSASKVPAKTVSAIEALGGRAVACQGSVTDQAVTQRCVELALDSFGSLAVVVNNAGTMRNGYFEDLTVADLDFIAGRSCAGVLFLLTQAAWPEFPPTQTMGVWS